MGYTVFRADELEFSPPGGGDLDRRLARLSDAMTQMCANLRRLPPGSRGRRHSEGVQEEALVVLEGTATLLLGDPAVAETLSRGTVAVVRPGTAIQVTNAGEEEAVVLIVGAPPLTGQAEYLPDALSS